MCASSGDGQQRCSVDSHTRQPPCSKKVGSERYKGRRQERRKRRERGEEEREEKEEKDREEEKEKEEREEEKEKEDREANLDAGGVLSCQHATAFGEVLEEGLMELLQERKKQQEKEGKIAEEEWEGEETEEELEEGEQGTEKVEQPKDGGGKRPLQRQPSIHQFLTAMVDIPKLVGFLESFPCFNCQQKVRVSAVQNQHGYLRLTLACGRATCGWVKDWEGSVERSQGKGMKQREVPSRLTRAMMLCGLTYNTYRLITMLADVGFMSKTAWEKGEEEQEKIIHYLWEVSSKRAIEEVKQRTEPLIVIFDARWSTGRFRGAEGSVVCIDFLSGNALYVEHLLKRGKKRTMREHPNQWKGRE